jgi:hypothetical protein
VAQAGKRNAKAIAADVGAAVPGRLLRLFGFQYINPNILK